MNINENYNLIKQLIKEKSLIELSSVLRIAGEQIFQNKKELEPYLYETYFLMVFVLKFFGDSEFEQEEFETIVNHLTEQFNKIDVILNPPIKKGHLRLIK